jgi:hypothetical protein
MHFDLIKYFEKFNELIGGKKGRNLLSPKRIKLTKDRRPILVLHQKAKEDFFWSCRSLTFVTRHAQTETRQIQADNIAHRRGKRRL